MIMTAAFIPPQTPALVIDKAALLQNLKTMQSACDAKAVRLRAHGKMHKCSTLGLLQVELGAVGLCCQTVGEAEAYARAGIKDLLVSSPVPTWGPARLAALAKETGASISCVADSAAQIDRLNEAASSVGVTLGCLVDVNIGMHRVGCSVEDAPALAHLIAESASLNFGGIQAYFGHLQHLPEEREAKNQASAATVAELVATLKAQGLAPPVVTGGGTGTFTTDLAQGIFTELQCGSYALMDREYEECGGPAGDWPFRQALLIAASVVSKQHKSHVTIDLGLKATSLDVHPKVAAGAPDRMIWRSLGDEHGALFDPTVPITTVEATDADPAIAWPVDHPAEGDIVWLQPGHIDPTVNLYDGYWVIEEGQAPKFWPIDARRVTPL
jgi:3-hydroxy-D-aspartate aldolase